MKVAELDGPLLDVWVAKAQGWSLHLGPSDMYARDSWLEQVDDKGTRRRYLWQRAASDLWEVGGPIIEQARILVGPRADGSWCAWPGKGGGTHAAHLEGLGPTPLIAAMRAYVMSVFGDEVPVLRLHCDDPALP